MRLEDTGLVDSERAEGTAGHSGARNPDPERQNTGPQRWEASGGLGPSALRFQLLLRDLNSMRGAKGLFKSWFPMEKISSADFHRVNPELARGFGFCGFLDKGELSWLQKKSRGSCLCPELPLEIAAARSRCRKGWGGGVCL